MTSQLLSTAGAYADLTSEARMEFTDILLGFLSAQRWAVPTPSGAGRRLKIFDLIAFPIITETVLNTFRMQGTINVSSIIIFAALTYFRTVKRARSLPF